MTHALKTWPEFYSKIVAEEKTFELRKNDRDFKLGDRILLQEFDPVTKKYTGKETEFNITYIMDNHYFGIKKGYCVMSIKRLDA